MSVPNLFDYATSELSQDAFFAWLLAWAHPAEGRRQAELHALGQELLRFFLAKGGNPRLAKTEISKVSVRRQDQRVDIACIVNDEIHLVIEDKVHAREHGDQLHAYRKARLNRTTDEKLVCVYLQTGDQDSYYAVKEAGFTPVRRRDVLQVLEGPVGQLASEKSEIVEQYVARLRRIEDQTSMFLTLPPAEWSGPETDMGRAWRGFFMWLKEESERPFLTDLGWGYVPNKAGGFWGAWCGWSPLGGGKLEAYLQIFGGSSPSLCARIHVGVMESGMRRELRDRIAASVRKACEEKGIQWSRPGRFGNGETMTVACLGGAFPVVGSDGLLDKEKTLQLLVDCTDLVKDVAARELASQPA